MGGISRWYVLYRWFWAVYHACWCAICFLDEGGLDSPISRKVFYFIYLTQWSYMILTTMNITWAIIVTKAHSESKAKHFLVKPTMTRKLKALWVLVNLSFLPAVLITTVYWLAIYDPSERKSFIIDLYDNFAQTSYRKLLCFTFADYPISATNVETHILNTVYVLIDLTVSAVPLRILHFYQPMFYLLVYLTFNLIYFLSGGLTPLGNHAIYPIMDWENLPLTIPFMLLTLLLIIVTQVS